MPDSPVRLQRLRAGVTASGARTLEAFRPLLADHANHPSGICCHPDPRQHPLEQGMTVTSVLMDLDAARMWVSPGNPCQAGYAELEFTGFVIVTADDRDSLEASCSEYEQVAAQSGLELRRLDGRHDLALPCLLPVGRGLARRRSW